MNDDSEKQVALDAWNKLKFLIHIQHILVYRKLGGFQFLGIPLSTQEHTGSWYVNFRLKQREQYAALNQIRTVNTSRLLERMGMVDKSDMRKVRDGFMQLYY